MRAQIRARIRRLFGLDAGRGPDGPAERDARRRARLADDARRWAKHEADERDMRAIERTVDSETLKARLEQRGALFPGE